jgi:hypothetical protein
MINFSKSQPAPASLAAQKKYDDEDVLQKLQSDFYNKCYLCEKIIINDFEVEHYQNHTTNKITDLAKKFDWNNLMYACVYCNSRKSGESFSGILNCTNASILIAEKIVFQLKTCNNPTEKVDISTTETDPTVQNTVKLLWRIHNGDCKIDLEYKPKAASKMKAKALRNLIIKDISNFMELKNNFYESENTAAQNIYLDRIKEELQPESQFLAFKIWYIKSKPSWERDFKPYFPLSVHTNI